MATKAVVVAAVIVVALGGVALLSETRGKAPVPGGGKSVLVIYHSGTTPWRSSAPLDKEGADALTQATTQPVNVTAVAERVRDELTGIGFRVDLKEATGIRGPKEMLTYDGIVFGTPTWFSNVAWPVKRVFDEHLIRIYEHREGKLNDKVLSGFVTVMERGESGPRCLRCLTWGLEHLSGRITEGIVINVLDSPKEVEARTREFCARFADALRK